MMMKRKGGAPPPRSQWHLSLAAPTNTRRDVRCKSEKTPYSSAIGSEKTLTIREHVYLKPTEKTECEEKKFVINELKAQKKEHTYKTSFQFYNARELWTIRNLGVED
jgi:hypothetical protein